MQTLVSNNIFNCAFTDDHKNTILLQMQSQILLTGHITYTQ